MLPTDLQKKDELRRELRLLEIIKRDVTPDSFGMQVLNDRLEDIKKALED